MKIVILHSDVAEGAGADELDVLVQVATVASVLEAQGHQLRTVPMSLDLDAAAKRLQAEAPDLVFNLVETLGGTGRLIHVAPALLDHLQIPYTGTAAEGLFLTSNKLLAKQLLQTHGVATPSWVSLCNGKAESRPVEGQYIIKSVWEHASIGLDASSVITPTDSAGLVAKMRSRAARLGGSCFAEVYIDGREFNLSLLANMDGVEVLPPAEIRFEHFPPGKRKLLDYRAKWETESFEYQNTLRCFDFGEKDSRLLQTLQDLALQCWQIFALGGYARVDFRVDTEGQPWILEVNANPCLAPDAGFHAACERAGYSLPEVIERILTDARRSII